MKRKIFGIAGMMLCLGIVVTIFLDFISVDFSEQGEIVKKILANIGFSDIKFAVSAKELLAFVVRLRKSFPGIESDMTAVFQQLALTMAIVYGLVLVIMAVVLFDRIWSWGVALCTALTALIVMLWTFLRIFPHGIVTVIDTQIEDGALSVVYSWLDSGLEERIRKVILSSLGVGFWICLACFALIMFLSLVRVIWIIADLRSKKLSYEVPGICCMFGDLKDSEIDIGNSPVVIGRDRRRCALILDEPGIDKIHCTVSFDRKKNLYRLLSASANGVFLVYGLSEERKQRKKNVALKTGRAYMLDRGTYIALGRKTNLLWLK